MNVLDRMEKTLSVYRVHVLLAGAHSCDSLCFLFFRVQPYRLESRRE
jgi:hypothetical protein